MPDQDTAATLEKLLTTTLTELSGMSRDMETMKVSQLTMAEAHKGLASAAQSMAETFRRAEERQERLEETNRSLYKDKGITPNVFYTVTLTLCSVIILGAAWITDTSVKATLTSFEAGKRQAETVQKVKEEIIKEVKKDG